MTHAATAPAPATTAPPVVGPLVVARRRRLARLLAGLLAAGAGTAGFLLAADDAPPAGTAAAPRLYFSLQTEDRREWAVCERGPCPTTPGLATPRREQVHRTRSITFVWSSPIRAATSAAGPAADAPSLR